MATAKPRGRGEDLKQHISSEQLQELSPEQWVELKRWWKPQQFDVFVFGNCGTSVVTAGVDMNGILWGTGGGFKLEDCLPLLSIGQCIELLNAKKKQNEHLEIHAPIGLISLWIVWYANGEFPEKYENAEFIDALFEALKSVL